MAEHKQSIGFEELIAHFEELEDPRSEINRKHSLVSVVVISLMGILGGASGPIGIRMWAGTKQEQLAALLPLPNGLPSRDVIRRVLCALKPEAFWRLITRPCHSDFAVTATLEAVLASTEPVETTQNIRSADH